MNTRKCFVWFLALMPIVFSNSHAQEADIGAIGRITPKNGIILVNCPAGNIIDSIDVQVGDSVENGKTMISLRAEDNERLNLEAARAALREANEMGPYSIELQRLKCKVAEEDLNYAIKRFERFKEIGGDTISQQQMEERAYQVQSAKLALEASQKELDRVELEQQYRKERASNNLKIAEQTIERLTVRAPINGTVLEILKNVGDRTDGTPVLRIADLREMTVVAEVFEGDLKKLSTGMKATISSNALSGKLTGHVYLISPIIERETKIAMVTILLDDPAEASRFINMETNVVINGK